MASPRNRGLVPSTRPKIAGSTIEAARKGDKPYGSRAGELREGLRRARGGLPRATEEIQDAPLRFGIEERLRFVLPAGGLDVDGA